MQRSHHHRHHFSSTSSPPLPSAHHEQPAAPITFIVSVTGPIARREEQVSSVVNVVLQRQAHVTRPLFIRIAAGGEALRALNATASATASTRLPALAEVLPEHQIHCEELLLPSSRVNKLIESLFVRFSLYFKILVTLYLSLIFNWTLSLSLDFHEFLSFEFRTSFNQFIPIKLIKSRLINERTTDSHQFGSKLCQQLISE